MKKLFFALTSLIAMTASAQLGLFSDGYRVGQLTKFSLKGVVFKNGRNADGKRVDSLQIYRVL